MQSSDRYDRQRRLPEVGDAGQTRLGEAELRVCGADGAMIETSYLHRAGISRLEIVPRAEPEPFVHEDAFRFAATRRVGAAAWRALSKIKRILDVT